MADDAVEVYNAYTGALVNTINTIPAGSWFYWALAVSPAAPVITSTLSVTGTANYPFRYRITADDVPTNFNAAHLPKGLLINHSTGVISGKPAASGTCAATITAINGNGSDTDTINFDFVPSPFTGIQGTYSGLVETDGSNTGLFTMTVTSIGSFTGKVNLPGISYSLKGAFDADLAYTGTSGNLSASLAIQAPSISGTVTVSSGPGPVSYIVDGSLLGTFKPGSLPKDIPGSYTVRIPIVDGTDPSQPSAAGYGTMTVSAKGAISICGKLGDGTAFSARSQLDTDGQTWTVFKPLYTGKHPGGVAGTMTFENLGNSDCDGTLEWIKPAQTTGYYPGGFSTSAELMAAKYVAPPLPLTSGTITVGGGNLAASAISDSLTISSKDKVTVSGTNDVTMTLTPGTGVFSGKFLYPGGDKKTPFSGVIYQKPTPTGFGMFLGADESGGVEITQ
jgi:hypothetical protein